jgi:hypothetical protein
LDALRGAESAALPRHSRRPITLVVPVSGALVVPASDALVVPVSDALVVPAVRCAGG